MSRSVAFYGFATATNGGIWDTKADEIWSIIWAYKYDLPRLDRLFEMHPVWIQAQSNKPEYQKVRDHWRWLKEECNIPVYMLIKHPEVASSVRYPIEFAKGLVPEQRRNAVFTSSFDYMMAAAILEGFKRIEPYGFEMGSDTEYRYQREGASYWIGYCDAHGIDLVLPKETRLLRKRLYGYQGGAMIYRQDLERMKEVREQQKRNAFAELGVIEGRMRQLLTDGRQADPEFEEAQKAWDEKYRMALVISGALQECEYYLKEIDLEEPSLELEDPVLFVKSE